MILVGFSTFRPIPPDLFLISFSSLSRLFLTSARPLSGLCQASVRPLSAVFYQSCPAIPEVQ